MENEDNNSTTDGVTNSENTEGISKPIQTADKQQVNSKVPPQLQAHCFKKGQSGNFEGRPKGKTLKEYCRHFLSKQTPEERQIFLDGLPKEIIWKMAEGNPKQDTEMSGEITVVKPLLDNVRKDVSNNNSIEENNIAE